MVMIHLCQHVDSVGVKFEVNVLYYPESIQLVAQNSLPKHKLCSIGAIQAVHAIRAAHSILQLNRCAIWAISKENIRYITWSRVSALTF